MTESYMKLEKSFVDAVYKAVMNKAQKAMFKRADSDALNHQSWAFLLRNGIDIENADDRDVASLIVASIARSKSEKNGSKTFPQALAACYPDGNASDAAAMKMRRVCSCDSVQELVDVLRPVLRLIESRIGGIDYVELYWGLRRYKFDDRRQDIQARWMKAFYSTSAQEDIQ